MSNLAIYLIGSVLVAAGFAFAAKKLGLDNSWVIIISLVIIGFGIMGGVRKTRNKEPAD